MEFDTSWRGTSSFPHVEWRFLFLTLPKELVREILSYLDQYELKNVALAFPDFADVANDRLLLRKLCLHPDDFSQKTLHQVLGGYVNVSELRVMGGLRFSKSSCQRIYKDLINLSHLRLHLSSPTKAIEQELLNVTTHLPHLTGLELNFLKPTFSKDGLLAALAKMKRLVQFYLIQTTAENCEVRQIGDTRGTECIDLNQLLTQLSLLRNAFLKDVRIDFQSSRDIRRCSHEGLNSLTRHRKTLTSLYLKHLEFNPKRARIGLPSLVISSLSHFKNLKQLGLTSVEGFSAASWIELFVVKPADGVLDANGIEASVEGIYSSLAVFPQLEVLELDFVPDVVLRHLGRVYGGSLRRVALFDYTQIYDVDGEGNTNCPREFSKILKSFKDLTKIMFGIKSNSFDVRVRRVLSWFINDELEPLPFLVEIAKL